MRFEIEPPGRDYKSLMEREPKIDIGEVMEALSDVQTPEAPEGKKKSKKPLVWGIVGGVAGLCLLGAGWWYFAPEGMPLTRSAVTVTESSKPTDQVKKSSEPSKDSEPKSSAKATQETTKSETPVETKPKETPVETQASKPTKSEEIPVTDEASKLVKTQNGTTIFIYKDKNLPPYEKPACGIMDEGCSEKGVSPADAYTGNNLNDEYLEFRTNLGYRKLGGLDENFVSADVIHGQMTDVVSRLQLDIPVPEKPDYASARFYSTGYSLWPISKGYYLIYGDSVGLGVIGPDANGDAFDKVLNSGNQVLISQVYADRKAVTFAPLNKKVAGAVVLESEAGWQ